MHGAGRVIIFNIPFQGKLYPKQPKNLPSGQEYHSLQSRYLGTGHSYQLSLPAQQKQKSMLSRFQSYEIFMSLSPTTPLASRRISQLPLSQKAAAGAAVIFKYREGPRK